jgi:hypothetical protein
VWHYRRSRSVQSLSRVSAGCQHLFSLSVSQVSSKVLVCVVVASKFWWRRMVLICRAEAGWDRDILAATAFDNSAVHSLWEMCRILLTTTPVPPTWVLRQRRYGHSKSSTSPHYLKT